jgi:hypothetical protein
VEEMVSGGDEASDSNNVDEGNTEEAQMLVKMSEIAHIDFSSLIEDDVKQFHFSDLEIAFSFYDMYAKVKGFGARKDSILRNKHGEIVQQTFVCDKEGYRQEKFVNMDNRKRKPKRQTRCWCQAKLRVHIYGDEGRWHVSYFSNHHNHEFIGEKYIGKAAKHRKIEELDIWEMNRMWEVGISTYQIFGSFAQQCGGFRNIGFNKKDMYN